jgi:hypothetical protein
VFVEGFLVLFTLCVLVGGALVLYMSPSKHK